MVRSGLIRGRVERFEATVLRFGYRETAKNFDAERPFIDADFRSCVAHAIQPTEPGDLCRGTAQFVGKEHQRMGGAVAAGDLAFKGAQIGAQVTPELPEVLALNIIIIRQ